MKIEDFYGPFKICWLMTNLFVLKSYAFSSLHLIILVQSWSTILRDATYVECIYQHLLYKPLVVIHIWLANITVYSPHLYTYRSCLSAETYLWILFSAFFHQLSAISLLTELLFLFFSSKEKGKLKFFLKVFLLVGYSGSPESLQRVYWWAQQL